MKVIIANYGNDSIALIQWVKSQQLAGVTILSVDTGWAAEGWAAHVKAARAWAESLGFRTVHLVPNLQFEELMQDKASFPTQKFQWCAGILKGLPILDWLDEHDLSCEAEILLATRRAQSKSLKHLPERIEESEHYGDRALWHPLYEHSIEQRDVLIAETPFSVLAHRSLECDPCVNSSPSDVQRMKESDVVKTAALETKLATTMLNFPGIPNCENCVKLKKQVQLKFASETKADDLSQFDMGCGAPYGCGT